MFFSIPDHLLLMMVPRLIDANLSSLHGNTRFTSREKNHLPFDPNGASGNTNSAKNEEKKALTFIFFSRRKRKSNLHIPMMTRGGDGKERKEGISHSHSKDWQKVHTSMRLRSTL